MALVAHSITTSEWSRYTVDAATRAAACTYVEHSECTYSRGLRVRREFHLRPTQTALATDASMTQPYPHTYEATASADLTGSVTVASPRLDPLRTAPPAEFGGPGNLWSPETLLVASIANCFVLTLRAVARAAAFPWLGVECHVEGVLERVEGVAQFSRFVTYATLNVPHGTDEAAARRLLERAEHGCLIGNSLRGARRLEATIVVPKAAAAAAS